MGTMGPHLSPSQSKQQSLTQMLFTKRNLLVFGAFALGCVITGYYFARKEASAPEHVPLILAETTPYKIRPENDEQPQIPHEDKLVYNRLAPAAGQPKVERLLPRPEQPILLESKPAPEPESVPRAELIQENPQDFNKEDMFPLASKPAAKAHQVVVLKAPKQETLALLPAKKPQARVKPSPAKVQKSSVKVVPERRPVLTRRPVSKKVVIPSRPTTNSRPAPIRSPQRRKGPVPAQKAQYRVQIAAMRTPTLARQEWHRLVSSNPQLRGLTPHLVRTDLGARKGIFYRVQGGRFVTKLQAQRFCNQLKQKTPKLPCMVVPIK